VQRLHYKAIGAPDGPAALSTGSRRVIESTSSWRVLFVGYVKQSVYIVVLLKLIN
jgi:hypothetical protein